MARRRHRRKHTHRKRRRGGSFMQKLKSAASSAHSFIKKNRLASRLAGHLGHKNLAGAIGRLGYGRPKHRRRAHSMRRGGSLAC